MQRAKKPRWSIKKVPRLIRKKRQSSNELVSLLASLGTISSFGVAAASVVQGFFTIQFYTRSLNISYLRPAFLQYSFTSFFVTFVVLMISIFMAVGSGIAAGYGQGHAALATSSSNSRLRRIRTFRDHKYFICALIFIYLIAFVLLCISIDKNIPMVFIAVLILVVLSNYFLYFYRNVFALDLYVVWPSILSAYSCFIFGFTFLPGSTIGNLNINKVVSFKVTILLFIPELLSIFLFFVSKSSFLLSTTKISYAINFKTFAAGMFLFIFLVIWILSWPFLLLPEHLMYNSGLGYFEIDNGTNRFCVAANVGEKMFLYPIIGHNTFIKAKAAEISMDTFINQPYVDAGTICPPVVDENAQSTKPVKSLQPTSSKYPTGG